jgi:cholinesterase
MQLFFKFLSILCLFVAYALEAQAKSYDKLYVFGDSYSDNGAGYLDGNGPTAVAYLAKKMNIPFTHSRDPKANDQGISFAVTAAGSGIGAGQPVGDLLLAVGMLNQVEDFAERVRSKKISFKPETTLFFIQGGLNDSETPAKFTTDNLSREIEILKSVGARHITVALLPTKVPDFRDAALKLNPEFRKIVPVLRKKLKIDLRLNRFGEYIDDIIEHPARYGITDTSKPCAGRALFNEDTTPCATPDTYFYYHGGHPSTAVNRIVGNKLYTEISGKGH